MTTIAEEVERAQQATLMRRFKVAVTVYMVAFVAAFFVPIYGEDKDGSQIILGLWNALLLLFMLSLAWVFRARDEANPYLFVGEDEAQNVHLDTRVRPSDTNVAMLHWNACAVFRNASTMAWTVALRGYVQ